MSISDRMQNDGLSFEEARMKESLAYDSINPKHYRSNPEGVECIQVTRYMNFNLGNVVKYLWRAGLKDSAPTLEDLKKARWYLDNEIARLDTANLFKCTCGWLGPPEQRVWHRNGVQLLCPRCNKDL
jgi:hypothetical protein